MSMVKFVVYGKPVPQGSTRAFMPKGFNRPIVTTDNKKLKPWRQQISATALTLGLTPVEREIPITLTADFFFERPKSATTKKRPGMTVKPDGDKILRALADGLTGILYVDDSQITHWVGRKHYGSPERVEVSVEWPEDAPTLLEGRQ